MDSQIFRMLKGGFFVVMVLNLPPKLMFVQPKTS